VQVIINDIKEAAKLVENAIACGYKKFAHLIKISKELTTLFLLYFGNSTQLLPLSISLMTNSTQYACF